MSETRRVFAPFESNKRIGVCFEVPKRSELSEISGLQVLNRARTARCLGMWFQCDDCNYAYCESENDRHSNALNQVCCEKCAELRKRGIRDARTQRIEDALLRKAKAKLAVIK